MTKNLRKKIITTLLVLPMLAQNVGISYAATENITDQEQISARSRVAKGVPYESFVAAQKKLPAVKAGLVGYDFIQGANGGFGYMPDESSSAYVLGLASYPFGDFVEYADKAFNITQIYGQTLGSLDVSMEAALLTRLVRSFKFVKQPDNVSCKVQYNIYGNKVTYERFKNTKYMYTLNKGNTKVYNYSVFENRNNNKVTKNIAFSDKKIEVYGIINGYAHTNHGFIKTSDLTSTKPQMPVEVSSIKLNKTSATIVKGRSTKLSATINPTNATTKSVKWTSSNTKVATVDANGNVKAVSAGSATITAKSNNGKTATCKVTVKNPYKTRSVKFTVNVPSSFKQKHYVEILDANNNVITASAAKTGSSVHNLTYQLDTSSSSYTRKIRIRTVSGNKKYDTATFKINSSTINKNVTATFKAGTTANSLKTGQITQK